MQLKAKLLQILPLQTGTGRNGEWKKQDIIVETLDTYPKKICISIWGDKINKDILSENQVFDFSVNIESREFNGKWYTDVKAWKIEKEQQSPVNQTKNMPGADDIPPNDFFVNNQEDDAPF